MSRNRFFCLIFSIFSLNLGNMWNERRINLINHVTIGYFYKNKIILYSESVRITIKVRQKNRGEVE